ncbi:MAG: OmpA family protein [Candidatus Adiutrix sp.]|jgi:chemotaxis protein MotB|nr:OmpA family protein [Candidatus Adiutrix sp.]
MSGDKKPPVIKKIIKKGHGGHHGGSWKVAYADFVTAMMAFFLVMWLLAISSEAGRAALADYFNDLTMYDAVFNGGLPSAFTEGGARQPGVMEGGCFSSKSEGDATIDTEGDSESARAQMAALVQTTKDFLENLDSLPEGVDGGEGSGDAGRSDENLPPPMSAGEQHFAEDLQARIQGSLGDAAAGQVLVEKIKGGLRIQIVDQEGRPMFRSGGPALSPEARGILDVVAERLRSLPNKISIEGHTDAQPFSDQRLTNWELSTARASAVRLYLAQQGLAEDRLTAVIGYAATQPLDQEHPDAPVNRRVSIMIWDEEPETPPPPRLPNGEAAPEPAPGAERPATADHGPTRKAPAGRQPSQRPPLPGSGGGQGRPLSGEELERQLIESTMEKAAIPDLSTVGPPSAPPSED